MLTRFTCRNWLNWPLCCLLSHGIRTSCFLTEMGLTLLIPHHSPNGHFVLFLRARVEVRALHMLTKHVLYTYKPSDTDLALFQPFSSPPTLERQESSKTVTAVQNQNFPKDWAVIILLSLLHRKGQVRGNCTEKGKVAQNTQFLEPSLCLGALSTLSVISYTL